MKREPPERTATLSVVIRKWAIRIGIAALAFEVFYLIAANVFLRTGLLTDLINKKPEKTNITWESAVTYLPGVATVSGFELRSQTGNNQIYLRVTEARTRISLLGLLSKTIHPRGVDARDVDFRYRPRLDRGGGLALQLYLTLSLMGLQLWVVLPTMSPLLLNVASRSPFRASSRW